MSNHRTVTVAAAVATLGLVGTALTSSSADAGQTTPPPVQRVSHRVTTPPVKCDGGALKRMNSRLSAEPFSFPGTSGANVAVPGAQLPLTGPTKGTDTVLVTFTAESYYTGSGWMSLQLHKDGVPVAPYADNGSPFAFTSENTYHGDSAQFCTKIGHGTHILALQASTTGDSSTDSGWIDDWTMTVQRFE